MVLIVAVLSVALNCYLLYRIWALAPLLGSEKLLEHFVKPLLPQDCTSSTFSLQCDEVFFSELREIVSKYSDFKPDYCNYFFGLVDDFKKFQIEFSGTDRNLQVSEKTIEKLIFNRVFSLTGLSTPVYSYAIKEKEVVYVVTFLYATDENGIQSLNDYIERERSLQKNVAETTVRDSDLEEEMNDL